MKVERNTSYKRQDLESDGIIELHALYKDTPLENTGSTFKIQGKANANRYVVSGQVGDAPPLGSAELSSGKLRFYVSGTDLSQNASLPQTQLYNIKDPESVVIAEGGMKLATTGDNASAKRDTPGQISLYTTYVDTGTPYLSETFTGADKTLGSNFIIDSGGGTNLVSMYPYLDPEDPKVAEALFVGGTQSWLSFMEDDLTTSEGLTNFFSAGDLAGANLSQTRASAGTFKLFIKPVKDSKPEGLWKNMLDKREEAQMFTIYPPFWRYDHIKPLIQYASEIATPTPASEDAETEPTTNNTIFNLIRMTPSQGTAHEGHPEGKTWALSDMKLSTDASDSGGQSLKMYNLWNFSKDNEETSSLYGLSGSSNTQFVMVSADCIPYPLYLDHTFSSEQTSVGHATNTGSAVMSMVRPEINIDFSISQLDTNPGFGFSMGQAHLSGNASAVPSDAECMEMKNYC